MMLFYHIFLENQYESLALRTYDTIPLQFSLNVRYFHHLYFTLLYSVGITKVNELLVLMKMEALDMVKWGDTLHKCGVFSWQYTCVLALIKWQMLKNLS